MNLSLPAAKALRDLTRAWQRAYPSVFESPEAVAEDLVRQALAHGWGPSELSLWRAAASQEIAEGAWQRATAGQLAQAQYSEICNSARNAQVSRNDAALMELLREYCPDSERIARYPG